VYVGNGLNTGTDLFGYSAHAAPYKNRKDEFDFHFDGSRNRFSIFILDFSNLISKIERKNIVEQPANAKYW
jgi:hypothetical protein